MKAVRFKCLDCMAGNEAEVRRCDIRECSLWEFRFGKNPTPEMAEEAQDAPVHGRDKELWESRPKTAKR
ncbi:MAG: hypothetical protein C4524_11500 [Candidatus Zixiibacteriota bacterium]|nr:MAG: hypothetical protein C4524_11500 [candidate division Zixibacteria bacterium]